MYNPIATYRIQFHKEFAFPDFEKILPYLQQLGIGTIYASPIFAATPGSTHGYDGVNPHLINPEVGTEDQLRDLSQQLQEQGIGWVQDIVPNHMAFHPDNLWLMDVLEKGPLSVFAEFFDVAWTSPLYKGRIMVPFLGAPLEEVIRNQELQVAYQQQRLVLKYYDSAYPLHLRTYLSVLEGTKSEHLASVDSLLTQLAEIHRLEDPTQYALQWHEFLLQFASLMKEEENQAVLQASLDQINRSRERLQQVADQQVYQLCHWQETDYQINFRRFFTVNGLICLNIQDPEVFKRYHKLIKSLLQEGVFQGLRIDHIDGLYDPTGYLEDLRKLAGEESYLVVEKILEPGEELPTRWPIQGSSGYDFLALLNNLFTRRSSKEIFTDFYDQLVGPGAEVHAQIHEKKAYILREHMGGELDNLTHLFQELNLAEKEKLAQVGRETLKNGIAQFLIQCPVYRYYGNRLPLDEEETAAVEVILRGIRRSHADLAPALDLLEEVFLEKPQEKHEDFNGRALRFYQRCMQFTGPLMAKGVEDTIMYTYNRFIGHNEVGDAPDAFGLAPADFHQLMQHRQENWPLSINGSSTHDTKRGEDVRARLNVLTDLPEKWLETVQEWQKLNQDLKQTGAPDPNDEYFIYQTLVGAYPMPEQDSDDIQGRMEEYLQKALREAKVHSNWTTPNEAYESATKAFATALLNPNRPFWKSFRTFHHKTADLGIVNSLAQVLLKFTCPGVPDVYQGTELWDLSLVDPDNRRAVDFGKRQKWLQELLAHDLSHQAELLAELWDHRYDGRVKLWLTHTLLNERKNNADLFSKGEYIPLEVEGAYQDHVFAFARKYHKIWYVVAVPLHPAVLCEQQGKVPLELDWKDTRVLLPQESPADWQHLLLKTAGRAAEKVLPVQALFRALPLALLKLQVRNERGAGILLHVTSLPSPFGIGDLGPEARRFADFLHRTRQKYWQLLPLNPTEREQGHSPYSSTSSRAGNPLLISPELLAREGLLPADGLRQYHLPRKAEVDYAEAERVKEELLEQAWQSFRTGDFATLHTQFTDFCRSEASWLDDFAEYILLKDQNGGKPWYAWPAEYKQRDPEAIRQLVSQNEEALQKTKWLQFTFSRQWKRLRTYCNNRGIQMFGDMPFYISYDSVDVWAHRDIFALDEEGRMTGVAGVPPDLFSDDGQLWGMPVFKWDVLREQNYDWWIGRLRKNVELFDLVRLDHFRAFADYWEVPAGEDTAKKGEWKLGPGSAFLSFVQQELGGLPFVAEDLGDISDIVYELRDQFDLAGMKVLMYAFGQDMPRNDFIPHNYSPNFIAYTGTHDNNTVLGWYRQEGKEHHRLIEQYVGRKLQERDMAWALGRLAFASVAKTAILPLQDLLNLDETARMNRPGDGQGNWLWRLLPDQITRPAEKTLREWTVMFNRD
jgi:malto-oligosyltrehalose synthase/4-alpha-glucanotransferase